MPTPRYCVIIAEVDGTELDFKEELALDSDKVYFTDDDFIADNAQDAIIELLGIAAPLRVPLPLIYNGTLSNGNWIGYSNLLPGDLTPIICPIDGFFVEFTWSNKSATADFALEFRKNSTVATPFFTWSVDNTKSAAIVLPTQEAFSIGDTIYIKYIDEGTNAQDAAIVLLFKS